MCVFLSHRQLSDLNMRAKQKSMLHRKVSNLIITMSYMFQVYNISDILL